MQILHALLPGHGLLGTFPGPGVGPRPLAPDRQSTAMPNAAIATDVAKPRDVLRDLPPQLAFHRVILVQQGRHAGQLVLAKLAGTGLRIDACLITQLAGDLRSHAVQVGQRDHRGAIGRDIYT